MPQVIRTPTAARDLDEIYDCIAIESARPVAAERLIRDIVDKCELYATHPKMGTSRPDLGDDFRVFSHKRYVVVYRPMADGIEVIRVVDGARDYPALFY